MIELMENLRNINNREIFYQKLDTEINWTQSLPDNNWLIVALAESDNSNILDEIARKVIDKDVCYACCIGTFGEELHDLIDETLVSREVEIENLHVPTHLVMTTWHKDVSNGLWFAIYSAFHETQSITKIICLDIGNDSRKIEIEELIEKFKNGFIPEDD
jgi:hypothetical protein